MMRAAASVFFIGLVCLLLGCTSVFERYRAYPGLYAGVRYDLKVLRVQKSPASRSDSWHDLPISAVADTVLLPYDLLIFPFRNPLEVEDQHYATNHIAWLSSRRSDTDWYEVIVLAETDALGNSRNVILKGKWPYFHGMRVPRNSLHDAWVEVTNNLVEIVLTHPRGIDFLSREGVVERVMHWREEAAKGSLASTNWYWVTHAEWPKWTDSKK
jgi:uncharacterized protein YceK